MPVSGTTAAAFLSFDQFHIVNLTGRSPDPIRSAARRMSCDREDIKHNTALNHICKALGFNGGFAGYNKEWPRLEQFLSQQGLKLDGLTQFDSPYPIHITPTQIAVRLLKSGKAIPFRVFTGTGWGCVRPDHHWRVSRFHAAAEPRIRGLSPRPTGSGHGRLALFSDNIGWGALHQGMRCGRVVVETRRCHQHAASWRDLRGIGTCV